MDEIMSIYIFHVCLRVLALEYVYSYRKLENTHSIYLLKIYPSIELTGSVSYGFVHIAFV